MHAAGSATRLRLRRTNRLDLQSGMHPRMIANSACIEYVNIMRREELDTYRCVAARCPHSERLALSQGLDRRGQGARVASPYRRHFVNPEGG